MLFDKTKWKLPSGVSQFGENPSPGLPSSGSILQGGVHSTGITPSLYLYDLKVLGFLPQASNT